jgi:L-iditol 2-dehydrogenase
MRAARLHGVRDLRVETLPVPRPGRGELLVRIEACGICPTDVRKYLLGVPDGNYPLNPGHEWVGRIEAVGDGVAGWEPGRRVYGDTYAGYAEFATISVEPGRWSHGAFEIGEHLPLERAVFVEPLADCLHAVHDQARLERSERVVVVGAGQMGLQLVLVASLAGARVIAVDPLAERRELAAALGAEGSVDTDGWSSLAADIVILTIGDAGLVEPALEALAPGGRLILFAGFGEGAQAVLDLNRIHYEEIAVVGSEWIGTPPNTRRERYRQALELLASGAASLERLVTARCGFDEIEAAYEAQRSHRALKTILVP